jgi:hypothetical protein
VKLVLGPGVRSQVLDHRPISRGNQGAGTVTCSYCHQMGHFFNHCPLIDDKLRQLL